MNKQGQTKLLAAIAVLVMVVCAFAVVMPSEDVEAVPEVPEQAPFGQQTGLTYADGVYTVSGNVTVNLVAGTTYGTEEAPMDIRFVFNGANASLTINSTTDKTVYINYTVSSLTNDSDRSVFCGSSSNPGKLVIGNHVTLDTEISLDAGVVANTNSAIGIFKWIDITADTGGKLVMHQAADVYGVTIQSGSITGNQGSTIVFDGANGASAMSKVTLNGATVQINNPNYSTISIPAGSEITDSTITGNSTNANNGAISFAGDTQVTGSTVDTGSADIRINEAATITATGSTLTTDGDIQAILSEATSDSATITGGTVSGNITHGISTGSSITFNGTTYSGTGSATADVSVNVGSNGLVVNGSLNLSNATAVTFESEGKLIASSGSSVNLGDKVSNADNIVAAPGSSVSGVDAETPATTDITDSAMLALYASTGLALTATNLSVTDSITLTNGTSLTVSGTLTIGTDATFSVGTNANLTVGGIDANGAISGMITVTYEGTLGAESIIQTTNFVGALSSGVINEFTSGEVTIQSGEIAIATAIPAGATINVQKGATLVLKPASGTTVAVSGTLNQYGVLTGGSQGSEVTLDIQKGGVYNAMSGATYGNYVKITVQEGGVANTSGAMNDADLDGYYSTDTTTALNQNMIVSENLTVTGGATLTIQGGLEILEGAVVYVEEGAKIIVNSGIADVVISGEINVYDTSSIEINESRSVTISGSIVTEESASLTISAPTELTGEASITSMGSITVTKGMEIGANATLNLQGATKLQGGVANSGTIVIDGATITTDRSYIQMSASGAVVNILSVELSGYASLLISDSDLTVSNTPGENDNEFALTYSNSNSSVSFEGITVTENITSRTENGNPVYDNSLSVSGNVSFDQNEVTTAGGTITFTGANIRVTDTLSVDENIAVAVSNAGTELFVDGTMTMADEVIMSLYNGAEVTVNGQIASYDEINDSNGIVNAVFYKAASEPRNIYTNLADAIEANSASTTTVTLTVLGTVVVEEDVDVPANIRVTVDAAGNLQVGTTTVRGITVDFADGSEFRGSATVYATMHFANYRNDRSNGAIISDVTIENGNEITYTNVATALSGAQPGDVITITGQNVEITADLTVPEQVTLVVPIGSYVTVYDGVTVTVNGTIDTQTGVSAQTAFGERADDNTSRLVVNGTFQTTETSDANFANLYVKYQVAGAYYQLLTENGQYKFIQPVTVAAESDATEIYIYGENSVDAVSFTGTETAPVLVTVAGAGTSSGVAYDAAELNAGSVTLAYATLDVNGKFDGTVGTAQGTVDVQNATGFTAVSTEVSDEPVFVVLGIVSQFDNFENADDAYFTVATGEVTVTNVDNVTQLSVNYPVEFSVATGATMTVTGVNAVVSAPTVTVNGTLVAERSGAANITSIYVLGTFTVGSADNANGISAGSSNVRTLYVGIDDEWIAYTGATVNAETALGSLTTIYVAAGNTISDAQTEGKRTTSYIVEDAEYMDVYTTSRALEIATVLTPELGGVYAPYWQYDLNGTMTRVTGEYVGNIPTVYAYIVEDVYLVTFTIESGISDVYVDGDLVATSGLSMQYGYVYVMLPVGEHVVTYRLDNGFSGTVTMTINGQTMTDGRFTLSADMPYLKDDVNYHNVNFEDPVDPYNGNTDFVAYNIVITGVEATGPTYPSAPSTDGDDGLGLTDILLIILVILIVVMAIIVALRLMRS